MLKMTLGVLSHYTGRFTTTKQNLQGGVYVELGWALCLITLKPVRTSLVTQYERWSTRTLVTTWHGRSMVTMRHHPWIVIKWNPAEVSQWKLILEPVILLGAD